MYNLTTRVVLAAVAAPFWPAASAELLHLFRSEAFTTTHRTTPSELARLTGRDGKGGPSRPAWVVDDSDGNDGDDDDDGGGTTTTAAPVAGSTVGVGDTVAEGEVFRTMAQEFEATHRVFRMPKRLLEQRNQRLAKIGAKVSDYDEGGSLSQAARKKREKPRLREALNARSPLLATLLPTPADRVADLERRRMRRVRATRARKERRKDGGGRRARGQRGGGSRPVDGSTSSLSPERLADMPGRNASLHDWLAYLNGTATAATGPGAGDAAAGNGGGSGGRSARTAPS